MKPRKTTKKKTPDKPKPKPCEWFDIVCQFQQKFTGAGGGAGIMPGLRQRQRLPIGLVRRPAITYPHLAYPS